MLDTERLAIARRLYTGLATAPLATGGWGYYAQKAARIEPTAWILLALTQSAVALDGVSPVDPRPHLAYLRRCQTRNGLLLEDPERPPNMTANGVAVCALMQSGLDDQRMVARVCEALVATKGLSVDEPDARQNNRLQAWPWIPDTFSWVEPTGWCVLALKRQRRDHPSTATSARIAEAEQMLANRSCDQGGWNFGNASVMGQELRPYVPTTAIGLLALQDKPGDPVVTRSLAQLEAAKLTEPSAMALSLTAICLRVHGRPASEVENRLASDIDRIERLGNLQSMAMTLLALTADAHNVEAFRV